MFLQDLIMGEDCIAKYQLDVKAREAVKLPNKLPNEIKSLFDISYLVDVNCWKPWLQTV